METQRQMLLLRTVVFFMKRDSSVKYAKTIAESILQNKLCKGTL